MVVGVGDFVYLLAAMWRRAWWEYLNVLASSLLARSMLMYAMRPFFTAKQ